MLSLSRARALVVGLAFSAAFWSGPNSPSFATEPETSSGSSAAEPAAVALEFGGRLYEPGVAILAKPHQTLDFALGVAPSAKRSVAPAPVLQNAPGGRGKGVASAERRERVEWEWSSGLGLSAEGRSLSWRTPEAGGHCFLSVLFREASGTGPSESRRRGEARFDILVQAEFQPGSFMLDGAPIGVYPDPTNQSAPAAVLNYPARYAAPRWFLEASPATRNLKLSPHFRVGDFAMDPARFGERQFIVVEPSLLDRLEAIRAAGLRAGHSAANIKVLRGYLTPLAAESLRHDGAEISEYSRFLYGDGAAIIVDNDGDGRMDDLNRDGAINGADARVLADWVEEMESSLGPGGLGIYGEAPDKTLPNTPFVHIDARGGLARWEYKMN
jgi:hypothetical protein